MLFPSKVSEVTRELLNSSKSRMLPEKAWLQGYGAARRFMKLGGEAASRRAKIANLLAERHWQWDRMAEELMQDPPLRVFQEGFDQVDELTPEKAREWEDWYAANLIPFDAGSTMAKFGLKEELEAAEVRCAKQANQNPRALQELRQRMAKGLGRLAGLYEQGQAKEVFRILVEDVIPSQGVLCVADSDKGRRQKMWTAYVSSREEKLPKAAAERYMQLMGENKQEEAHQWLNESVEAEVFPWELRPPRETVLAAGQVGNEAAAPPPGYRCEPSRVRLMIHDEGLQRDFDGWVEGKIRARFERELEDELTNMVEDFEGREEDFQKAALLAAELEDISREHSYQHGRLDAMGQELTKQRIAFLALTAHRDLLDELDELNNQALHRLTCTELQGKKARVAELKTAVSNPPENLDEKYRLSDGFNADFVRDRRSVGALESRVGALAFRKCIVVPALKVLTVMAFVAAVGIAIHSWVKSSAKATELRGLVEANEVLPMEIAIDEAAVERGGAPWQSLYQRIGPWKEAVTEAELWTEEQREMERQLKVALVQLEDLQRAAFDQKPYQKTEDRLKKAETDAELLATDLREQMTPRTADLRQAWERFVRDTAEALARQIQGVLDASAQSLNGLREREGDFDPTDFADVLQTLGEELTKSAHLLNPEFDRLEPHEDLRTAYENRLAQLAELRDDAKVLIPRLAALKSSHSFAAHKTVLGQMSSLPEKLWSFLPPNLYLDYQSVSATLEDARTFSSILLGEADADLAAGRLLPAEVDMNENALRLELVGDWKLTEIHRYVQSDDRDAPVFAKGELEQIRRPGNEEVIYESSGTYYLTSKSPHNADFETGVELMKERGSGNLPASSRARTGMVPIHGKKSNESREFEALGLRAMVRAGTPLTYATSYLAMVDRVLSWPDSINVLFKAYVHMKLGEILMVRPEEWGLQRTSFEDDLRRLAELRDRSGRRLHLEADSWMVPEEVERWSKPLSDYYQSLKEIVYEEQYRTVSSMVASLSQGAFSYVGYLDHNGILQLTAETAMAANEPQRYWILAQRGGAATPLIVEASAGEHLTQRLVIGKGVPLRFSPVLVNGEAVAHLIASSKNNAQLRRFFDSWLKMLEAD